MLACRTLHGSALRLALFPSAVFPCDAARYRGNHIHHRHLIQSGFVATDRLPM